MKNFFPVFLLLLSVSIALASTADEISKNANSLIRTAEKEFFSGKTSEAATILLKVEDSLVELKSEDPDHRSLKSLQTKYDRLKTRVDKKLGQSSPAAEPAAKGSSGHDQQLTSKDLSHGAKSNLKNAAREMDFAERELAKGEKSLQGKKFNMVDSHIFNANSKLENAGGLLDKVINNNKANPEHPNVAAALQRHKALQENVTAFASKAQREKDSVTQAVTQLKENESKLNQKWLPKITAFTNTTSKSRLQYPGSYNKQELDRQEKLYGDARTVLEEVEKDVPGGTFSNEMKTAIDNLLFTLQVYQDNKTADQKNRLQPIENTLSGWEKRFAQNKNWQEKSDVTLFTITREKLNHQKNQISELAKVAADSASGFSNRLAALEKENTIWVEKKRLWLERPRPFPRAKMKSKQLEKDMARLLADRNIEVKDLVIVDKDWWVQQGEFRYVTTAVLSRDSKGEYWSNISFRQLQTLTGFGPTEILDINEIRIRLP